MARVNVYLSNDLASAAKAAGLNVSGLAQEAIRGALAARRTDDWLDRVSSMPSTRVEHARVAEAVEAAKDEIEGHA